MNKKLLSGSFLAVLTCGVALSAQPPAQQPSTPPRSEQAPAASAPQLTLTGCVQKETDVLKGGLTSSMPGMADEFVLTAVTPAASAAGDQPRPEPRPTEGVGTAGAKSAGKVYRMTGDKEKDLKSYVGQRVQIVGAFKNPADANREPAATGTSGRELTRENTPEITIQSISPASGTCPGGEAK